MIIAKIITDQLFAVIKNYNEDNLNEAEQKVLANIKACYKILNKD